MASITVIGAGIAGLSVAWELTRRGASVRVVEADRIGAGSSGGTVGALAPHAPESWNLKKQLQLDSLLGAASFWDEVAQAGGVDPGYARTGRIQAVALADLDKLRARVDGAARHWQGAARMWLTQAPEAALIPRSEDGWWLMDDLTARLSPRQAGAALAAAIRAKGGEIATGQHATPDAVATPAIWATGTPGLEMLSCDLGRKIGQGVKGQSASLRFPAPDTPQVYAEGLHIVPHADGTVGVGSTSENQYEHTGVDTLLDDVITNARATCPELKDAEVLSCWAGIRPRARSRAPLLGAWPGRAGHFVANGGFKIGFGMAPVMARMTADLVLEGRDTIPDLFRLQGSGDTPITAG
ncbi:FAD-binding oxidoreductase [Paracoccus sp. SCSIO 75233]|uniref:NAD(P)/FAD-dependent oxidoreductase n=1 Tax=Paracoccus sp. SCSIO 75233 TaxID=3017782 RepID=UPI0022F1054D|nr:FAD-dependent oxidoreductase [Paracoccus sp. SCSIO 75233]WBU52723.1 FAD-dependent oxidoreductase [Paracoccus sp. SCSIO 75233]